MRLFPFMDLIEAGAWGHLWKKEAPLEEKYDWMTEEVKNLFGEGE